MRSLAGPLTIAAARARRSRTWILPTLALALVFGFAGALASESVIVGDQAARADLREIAPPDRAIRLVWEGPLTPYGVHTAHGVFSRLSLPRPTEVLLLNPVRLSGSIVHPIAIEPIQRWLPVGGIRRLGRCRAANCPVLLASQARVPPTLASAGVRMRVVGRAALSTALLGYSRSGDWPIVVTGDISGLGRIEGLSGVYRTYSWVALVPLARLHSWNLPEFESRLRAAQAAVSPLSTRFTFEGPFFALDAARERGVVATDRLLLVDGGVLVALVLFILLASSVLQRDQAAELERLRHAGGRGLHAVVFLLVEAAWISAVALLVGLGLGIALTSIPASGAGDPLGAVLNHGLLSWTSAWVIALGWLATTTLLAVAPLLKGRRILDVAALAAAAALVAGLVLGTGSTTTWTGLLVPLVCLSAGMVLFRAIGVVIRGGERIARRGSVSLRLALIGLSRARSSAGLAIAFLAISTALAGFALSFRATLIRGAADRAADRVPLDALVGAGSTLASPLEVAPLARWRVLSHGVVYPVRRTQASYAAGGGTPTVPALGVPAAALPRMHGWRLSDGPAPLAVLARRLRPPGPARTPGPSVPTAARTVGLAVRSPVLDLAVTLDLRGGDGTVRQLSLGTTGLHPRILRARVPAGRWEVQAIELNELSGTAITNGHQNGENPAPATQFSAQLKLGPLLAVDRGGRPLTRTSLRAWRAVGAAAGATAAQRDDPAVQVVFQNSGWPGVVRPPQPSDFRALPILVDPRTAAGAGPGGRIGLTVDGQPIQARVVGVLRRFPTIDQQAGGFVVADQALLAGALDAQLPGQGQPDELWISSARPAALRRALHGGPLSQLRVAFRAEVDHSLRSDPVASGVSRMLLASGIVAILLALIGVALVLVGPLRAPRIQADLEAQGLGPTGLRRELRIRLVAASVLGIGPGLAIALLLDRLAVGAVGAYEAGASQPPLITIIPWAEMVGLGVGLSILCLACAWLVSELLLPRRQRPRSPRVLRDQPPVDELAKELVR
jgi:hypothetical protein